MTDFKPTLAFRDFDRLAARSDEASVRAAIRWIRDMRARFMAVPDPLVRARFLLRAAGLRETDQPVSELVQDLQLALGVFRAQDQPVDTAICLARLAHWYTRAGFNTMALLCGHGALTRSELPAGERWRLTAARAVALASERQFSAAWALIDAVDVDRVAPTDAWLLHAARGMLHVGEALRARREVSLYALDVDPGPVDWEAHARHVAASRACMGRINEAARGIATTRHIIAMGAALDADTAAVDALFDQPDSGRRSPAYEALEQYNHAWCRRILGEASRARQLHLQSLDLIDKLGNLRVEAATCLDLYACAMALGDPAEAVAWLARFQRVRARLDGSNLEALLSMTAVLDQPVVDGQALASGKADATAVPQAEPAVLAQAEDLFVRQLPRRMRLGELADELGVSLRTLQVAARRHRSCTLGDMLRRRLMDRALELLRHTDFPMAEVALELGYTEPGSLSRDVRRHFGCTPRQLRSGAAMRTRSKDGLDTEVARPDFARGPAPRRPLSPDPAARGSPSRSR